MASSKGEEDEVLKANVEVTCNDLKENSQAWFGFEVEFLKKD